MNVKSGGKRDKREEEGGVKRKEEAEDEGYEKGKKYKKNNEDGSRGRRQGGQREKKGAWTSGQCRPKRQTILIYSCICYQSVFEINRLTMTIICSLCFAETGSVQAIGQSRGGGSRNICRERKTKNQQKKENEGWNNR